MRTFFSSFPKAISYLFITGLLASTINLSAQTKQDSLSLKAFLDLELNELFSSVKAVGGSVAFVEKGRVTYANGFGFADRKNGLPATATTIYRTASMTKAMTSVALLKLQQSGKLDINAPLDRYLPELQLINREGQKQAVHILDIMTHFSGLPSDILNGMVAQNQSEKDGWLVDLLNGQPLSTSANFNQAYSNVGYGLLGLLISRVSGMDYADYLQQEVFRPLGMTTAQIGDPAAGMARGYVGKKAIQLDFSRTPAAAAATASVLDMAEFLKLLLRKHPTGETVLSESSRRQLERDYVGKSFLPIAFGYGLGVDIRHATFASKEGELPVTIHKHSGDGIAFHGEFGYIPELGVGVIIMTNTNRAFRACSTKDLLDLYLKHLHGGKTVIDYNIPDHGLSVPTDQEVIGSYNIGPAGLEVTNTDKLTFKMGGVRAVLRQRPGTMSYDVGLRLLGIIPVKVKDVVFEFVRKEGRVFLRQVNIERGAPEYLGERIVKPKLSQAWERMLGDYELTNSIPSHNKKFDFATANIRLLKRDGWPVLSIRTSGMKYEMCLTIISDELAITGGIGRHAGDPVQLLSGKRLRFSGMELRRKN